MALTKLWETPILAIAYFRSLAFAASDRQIRKQYPWCP